MKSKLIAILSVLLLMISIGLPCYADEAAPYDFHALFQRVENMDESEKDTLSEELSTVFHQYPFEFIKALTQEDYGLHDPVRKMLAEYNTYDDGNADYLQFLLSLFPKMREELEGGENNTFLTLLLAFDPDPRNAGENFIPTLFTALRYADGIGADQCSTVLFRIFRQDPKTLVRALANEDQEFQTLAVGQLNYGSWGHEAEFLDNINALAADDSLTAAERSIVDALLETVTPVVDTTAPAVELETTPSTEIETTAPTETQPITAQPDSKPSGISTVTIIGVAASILAIVAIVYMAKQRKQ